MSADNQFPSWTLLPKVKNENWIRVDKSSTSLPSNSLPRGLGRSYGDVCLNDGGTLLLTNLYDKFISFDQNSGTLTCEAGVTFDEILKVFVPKGWFLPVTPGTKFVTVGGAIANDIHDKNHHVAGNFGNHILSLRLRRGDGSSVNCSEDKNSELFKATIGGLGLTGLIETATFKLIPIKSAYIDQEQIRFHSLKEFMEISNCSEKGYAYTVAWVDCINGQDIRGIFIRGNHSNSGDLIAHDPPKLSVPIFFPQWILNSLSIRLFNLLYYFKNYKKLLKSQIHYEKFFYPLDSIHHWNKIYGRRGFYQYQFVVPYSKHGEQALTEIFKLIKQSGMGSFLAVLKTFGQVPPKGLMSFPEPGITLALDFANFGSPLLDLLDKCDKILEQSHGRIYPAKDARMSAEFFNKTYPTDEFKKHIDPRLSSSFSKRMKL